MKSHFSAHHYFDSRYVVTTPLFPPQSSPRLCDFSQWIDDKIHPYDMSMLLTWKSWAREDWEGRERHLEELLAEMEKKRRERLHEEQEREHARRHEAERARKRAIAAKAKAQGEEYNAELGRKGKWPRSTQ